MTSASCPAGSTASDASRHTRLRRLRHIAILLVVVALGLWIYSRWDAWFYNPPELPYQAPSTPGRIVLTFGDEGETSRYVTWICGSTVDAEAHLLLACDADTLRVAATGEVSATRAGTAAYYRAHLAGLRPGQTYDYAVVTGGQASDWHRFSIADPSAQEFSFLYMGDVQDTIGSAIDTTLQHVVRLYPEVEFVTFGGDLVERPTHQHWELTYGNLSPVCTTLPILNITGNHDYLKYLIRHCERRFALTFAYFLQGMDERDDQNHLFHLRYHNTDLLLLDSDRGPGYLMAQRQWLGKELDACEGRHKVLLLHHPLYSIRHANNNLVARWMFDGLVRDKGIDLVLQGHEHAFTRCTAADTAVTAPVVAAPLYLISHCSPKNYRIHPTPRFYPIHNDSRYYHIVHVSHDTISITSYDADTDECIDQVTLAQ